MPDTKITALTAIGVVNPALDPLPIVDVDDTSMAASGTTKKISINQILGAGGAGSFSTLAASGAATLSSTLGVTGATTLTGALTANGNVTLGNVLSDVITVTGSLTARDGELASSIRGAASDYAGVAFDGATSSTRVVSGSQAIGTGPFSVWSRFKVPASVPASGNGTNPGIWGLSDSNNATYRDNAVVSYLDSSNGLNLFRYGANKATDFRLARISNFVNTYAGQVVDIVITRSENTLKIYINGTDTDYTETTGGTPPAWGNTIVSDFLIVGAQSSVNVFGSSIYRSVLFNRALSAADVVDLIELGVDPADQWGTQTQIVNTTTLNGGFETAGAGGADVFANWVEYTTGTATITRDTVDYSPDLGSTASAKYVGTDGTAVFSLYNSSAGNLLAGKRYRISSAHKRSANANIAWRTTDGNVALVTFAVTTSWANYVGEFVMPTNDSVKIDGSGANSLWIDNVILERIGAIVDLDFTAGIGYQALDRSTNKLDGTLFGGVSWAGAGFSGTVRGTLTTNAGQQLNGTLAIPTDAHIDYVVVENVSAGSGRTFSLGTASGTLTNIINAQPLGANGTRTTFDPADGFSSTGNLWAAWSAAGTVKVTVAYRQVL